MHQRITQITLAPEGGQIFDEGNYTITVVDEGGGEFIEVCELQHADAPKIRIDKSDWPALRDAIDRMMGEIRPEFDEATESAWRDPLTERLAEHDLERQTAAEAEQQGTEQEPQSIELPDSVLRIMSIGIVAQSYALTGSKFCNDDLFLIEKDLKARTKEAREYIAELIAEARK